MTDIVKLKAEPSENHSELVSTGQDWEKLMDHYLKSLDVRENTRETYRWGLIRYFNWIVESGLQLDALSPADIVRYKATLIKSEMSSLTVASYMTAVRQFYRWAEENMMYPNIARSVRPSRGLKGIRKMHLSEPEAARLLDYLKEHSQRDHAMVNLIMRTGLRTIEVHRADVGDIVFRRGVRVLKIWGKGRDEKAEYVILNDPVWLPLKEYIGTRRDKGPKEPLFITEGKGCRGTRISVREVQHICKEALRAIGLDGHEYSAHSLRHTTAVTILKHGGDWKDVQRVLRHVSPTTSQIYTSTIEEEMRLKRNPESFLDDAFKPEHNQ